MRARGAVAPAAGRVRVEPPPTRPVVLGYLVPEFPGQTHTFFRREIEALERAGARPVLVSTRRPRRPAAHPWAPAAAARTTYLADPSPAGVLAAAGVLARALRGGQWRALAREARAAAAPAGTHPAPRGPVAAVRRAGRTAVLVAAGARLAALARAGGWAHVHVHSCGHAAQVAAFARLLGGPPTSLTLHGPLGDYGGNQRGKWRGAAFGLVITEGLRRDVAAALGPDLPPVVAVAPMGVDPERFARSRPYESWKGSGPLRLVATGRLNPAKGHDDLLRAVRLLVDDGTDARLVVLGEDEQGGVGHRRDLEALVAALGLADRVRLPGAVGEDRVRAALEDAHVFALASHAEPLGVAVMEALALELPAVVCAGGGVGELVRDGDTGLLVPPRDPAALAAAVARVAGDPDLARGLGRRGRAHVAASYASARGARTLLDLVGATTTGGRS